MSIEAVSCTPPPSGTLPRPVTSRGAGRDASSTPEEVETVRPFVRRLVEDYGYPRSHIRTHPQWHVRRSPSDEGYSYPVDIAVFSSEEHREDTLSIVVECKQPTRKKGRKQLETYLSLCPAQVGVWTNGTDFLYLRKTHDGGRIGFAEVPNIPSYGQDIDDLGRFLRKDLVATHNLRSVFRTIRHRLAANAVGMTRDEALARELINLVFCKIYDERFTRPDHLVSFRAGAKERAASVAERVRGLFGHVVSSYDDVFGSDDRLELDDESITWVVGQLQQYCLTECERDVVADAFEVFVGSSLKGPQGQFFTPRNVTQLVCEMVGIRVSDRVLDPACGSGGFLVEALRRLWSLVDAQARAFEWPEGERLSERQKVAIRQVRGIDKDDFLARVTKAYMALLGDGRGGVFCENSLVPVEQWQPPTRHEIQVGGFDVIMTNPPFGKNLKITDERLLSGYDLAHRWSRDPDGGLGGPGEALLDSQTPQILFIERCLDLLREGGRVGMVLPESVLCNPSYRYVMRYIRSRCSIRAVVSMHEDLFQPYTHAKTAVVILEKGRGNEEHGGVFMADARWCGHDSRGNPVPYDDLPQVAERWKRYVSGEDLDYSHLGFVVDSEDIHDDIFLPRYYDPEIGSRLAALGRTHDLVTLGDLADRGVIAVSTGDEVGKLAYGTGSIPFIRTSDIAGWQVKPDPKHGVSEEIYRRLAAKQHVEADDVLMVRDGTYLVGTCAILTERETRIVFQSHILRFKVLDRSVITPELLIALLGSEPVRAQIRAKRFTQDIIDSLGSRWRELVLPVPREPSAVAAVTSRVRRSIELREEAQRMSAQACAMVLGSPESSGSRTGFSVINSTGRI